MPCTVTPLCVDLWIFRSKLEEANRTWVDIVVTDDFDGDKDDKDDQQNEDRHQHLF